jgi:hypothetical protein
LQGVQRVSLVNIVTQWQWYPLQIRLISLEEIGSDLGIKETWMDPYEFPMLLSLSVQFGGPVKGPGFLSVFVDATTPDTNEGA